MELPQSPQSWQTFSVAASPAEFTVVFAIVLPTAVVRCGLSLVLVTFIHNLDMSASAQVSGCTPWFESILSMHFRVHY